MSDTIASLEGWFQPAKRKRSKPAGREKRTQAAIVRDLRAMGWMVTTFSQAQRAQQTAGIPDVWAAHSRWGSMWIEVKDPKRRGERYGGCSPIQLAWQANARECGQCVLVAYGICDILPELRKRGAVL